MIKDLNVEYLKLIVGKVNKSALEEFEIRLCGLVKRYVTFDYSIY